MIIVDKALQARTVGCILKVYADRAGIILSACDRDQPGVQMNLYWFVKSIGLTPLLCGNITYDDVELAKGRLCNKLRAEQNAYFASSKTPVAVR
jgi:predicted homoserine dehydrogenase-like protein